MPSKIIRLAVTNMLRIEAAEVRPDGAVIIVAGDNDQGKTSLLNCIGLALSGKHKFPQPIRQGASKGEIVLETETLTVKRSFRVAGGGKLEVRDKDKGVLTSPQTKLDTLFRLTTFDPLRFTNMEPKEQATTLRDVAGLDTSEIDAEYQRIFTARTEVGRKAKDQEGRVNGITRDTTAPEQPISVADLSRQLQEANATNQANAQAHEAVTDHFDAVAQREQALEDCAVTVTEAEKALERAKAAFFEAKRILADSQKEAEDAKMAAAALADIDTAPIIAQIENAETINAKVRANADWTREHSRLVELQGEYQTLTEKLAGLMGTRESRIAKAKYPVEGLGFNEDGVTFEGVPFEQCSSSKQIRVSLAIACALNPELRVMLIRDGSLLDPKSLELVREFAEKHEAQVFMECVGQRDDATVIIEAGNVVAEPVREAKAKKKK